MRQEAPVRQRGSQLDERHLQEGDEQHQCQRGIDQDFQPAGAGYGQRDGEAERNRQKIDRDLVPFQSVTHIVQPTHGVTAVPCRMPRHKARLRWRKYCKPALLAMLLTSRIPQDLDAPLQGDHRHRKTDD